VLTQLKRHKDLLRSEHKWRKRPARAAEVAQTDGAATPEALSNNGETSNENAGGISASAFDGNSKDLFESDVRQFLNANLGRLERYIDRELKAREVNAQIDSGRLSREEVIDEVVVSALSAEERPTALPLERWIYRLAIQAIQHLSSDGDGAGEEFVSLDQSVAERNVTGSDEEILQYHQPGETLHREDTIPDRAAGNPEELASNDELVEELENALQGATPESREAFVLYTIEGFTLKEIAEVTDRPVEKIRADIAEARDHVFKKLPPGNAIKKRMQRQDVA
jgi:RNA polymerase sigma factor (sigma-70 family)